MIRRLIATTIVLAVGIILVSPCVDIDDAVHHHPHHHHVSVSPHEAAFEAVTINDNTALLKEPPSTSLVFSPTTSAMRC